MLTVQRSPIDVQHLGQRRDAHAGEGRVVMTACIQGGQLRCGETGDGALSIGGGVHVKIVDDDQFTIFGAVNIQFDAVHAHIQRRLKRRQRILRGNGFGPSMGKNTGMSNHAFPASVRSRSLRHLVG